MILPIVLYGNPILRKECYNIDKDYPYLQLLINDMFETMDNSKGIGLSAPQIGLSINLFVININNIKKVLINPNILFKYTDNDIKEEGCLSIPGIWEQIERPVKISIEYYNKDFEYKKEIFEKDISRVIQHEYDHIQGKLFIDYLSYLRKRLLKSKLDKIIKCKQIKR